MDKERKKKVLAQLSSTLQEFFINQMSVMVVKTTLRLILKTPMAVGARASIITFLAKEAFDEFGEPTARAVFVEMGYTFDRIDGNIKVKKLRNAREGGNVQDYNDAADDIMD